ncbi:hypothetical protein V1521DRAFT_291292 [Lipomyces starkeyi]
MGHGYFRVNCALLERILLLFAHALCHFFDPRHPAILLTGRLNSTSELGQDVLLCAPNLCGLLGRRARAMGGI